MRRSFPRLLHAALCVGLCAALALPARAEKWLVKRRGQSPVFIQRYKRLLEGRPEMGFVFKRLLQLYGTRGGAAELIRSYKAAAERQPSSWQIQTILGHLYRHAGKLDEAVVHYRDARKIAPGEYLPAFSLAEALAAMREVAGAERAYEEALKLARKEDDRRDCLQKLATLALREGQIDKARKRFRQLFTVGPRNLQAREDLAALLARHGLNAEALSEYEAVLARVRRDNKKVALLLREIGGLREKLGKLEEAVASYRRALKLLGRSHWLRRELLERIIDVHRRRGTLAELAAEYEARRRDPDAAFLLAKLYEELGRDEKAIRSLRKVLEARPRDTEARLKLIDLLEGQQRSDEAIAEYRRLVRQDPEDPEHRLRLARAYFRRNQRKLAEQALRDAERKFEKSIPVLKQIAELYAKHGLLERARATTAALVALDPRDPEHRQRLGDLLLALGKLGEAERNWKEVVSTEPDRSAGWVRLAQIYLGHGLTEKAIAALKDAVRTDPQNVEARLELARALSRARRAREALEAWRETWRLAREPKHLRAAETQLIALYEQLGLLAEVVVEQRDAFHQNPKDLRVGRLLGSLFLKVKDLVGAERTFLEILKHHPNDVETLLDLEKLYAARGEITRSRDLLVRAAQIDRRRARRHYRRAVEYTLKAGSVSEAVDLARKVVDLNPMNPEAHGQLGELYEKANRDGDAVQAYTRAIQLAPQAFKWQLLLGDVQRRIGKPGEAHATYRAVIAGSTDESTVLEAARRLIALGREQGRMKEIERELKQLSAANPKSMAHYQAVAELYRSMGRLDQVDAVLERASRRTSDRSSALGLLAAQAREKGDVRRAISYMRRQILESDKPSAAQYRALAELYFELGDNLRAKGVIEEMIATVGDKARAYQAAAALFQKYQMPEEALRALGKQVDHNPADLATKLKLARLYVDADRLREAEALLKDIVDSAIGVGPSLERPAAAQPAPPAPGPRSPHWGFGTTPWTPPQAAAQPAATGNSADLRREALGLLVNIYERWGNPEALTARLEQGLSHRDRARQLLADLVSIYRLRGQSDKVAEFLQRGVILYPREPRWHSLLAQIEAERGRWREALKIYESLEKRVDRRHARDWVLKRIEILLEHDQEKEAKEVVEEHLAGRRRAVGFLTRAAELFAGRGNFAQAIALLERVPRDDSGSRSLVRGKLVEYQIAAGRRADAAKVLSEALDEEARAPIANPTGVFTQRERNVRRLFELLDQPGRERFVARRKELARAEPENLLVLIDLYLAGVLAGDEVMMREPLPAMLKLGYRDRQLVAVSLERLVLASDFARLGPALEELLGGIRDAQERKKIAEQALTQMRTHRRVPPEALAARLTRAYLGENPGTAELKSLGELYAAWGNFRKAAGFYERALAKAPGDPELYRHLGRLYQQMGEPDRSKAIFKQAIARGALPAPPNAPAGSDPFERAVHRLKEVIATYRAAGELDALERRLTEAARSSPDDPAAHYELAAFLHNLGHRGRALSIIEKLADNRRKDPEVLEVLGRLYKERRDFRTAARLFERSLKLGSFQKRALYRDLSHCYRRIGEEHKAFELERQMAWEMGDEFALYRLALQLQKDGRRDESIQAYKRYLTLKYARYTHLSGRRRSLRIALELAKFIQSNNQARRALQELEGYLALVRGLPVSSFERRNFIQQLTDLYRRAGTLEAKLAEWDRKSRRDPFFLDLLYHYHESQGNAERKLKLLERTVALRPRDERRIEALAEEYARRARYDDAIRTLQRLEGFASSPNYLLRIGSYFHYKGEREQALESWRKYVEARFTYPTFRDFRSRRLFALAEILDREGYREEAERARIEAVEAAAAVDAYQYGRIIGEYVRRGRYDAAMAITLKALEKVTDLQQRRNLFYALLPYGYYALRHLQGLRETVDTKKLFEGAESDPSRAEMAHLFYDILGERYRSAGNEQKAAEAFELALRFKDDADTLRNLVAIYKRLGREVEIARLYERLLQHRPNHSAYLRAAADAYLGLRQLDRALPLLERDARSNPSVEAYLRLVDVHRKLGQPAKAEPFLLEARKLAPDSLDIAEKLEEIYRTLPDKTKLRAFYESLHFSEKIPPSDLPRLATLMEKGGRAHTAIEVYKLAYVRAPPGSWVRRQAQDKLTRALSRLGHADLADEELLSELPDAAARSAVHERLADLLQKHQMPAKALAQIKRAAFLTPSRADLWRAAARLAAELGIRAEAQALLAWGRAVVPQDRELAEMERGLAVHPTPQRPALRRVLWRASLSGGCAVAPEIAGASVIAVDCARGEVAAFGLTDGIRRWRWKLPPLPERVERGGLSFEWRYRVTGLGVAHDRVVVAANEDQFESAPGLGTGRVRRLHLAAVRVADGKELWHRVYPGDYAGGPIEIASETILLHGQNLRAFSLRTGRSLWHAHAGSLAYGWIFDKKNGTRPAASGDAVYAAGMDGRLYALDLTSGRKRWELAAGAPIHGSPLAAGDAVFFLGDDGYLHAVDAETGKERWRTRAGGDARTESLRYGHGYYTRARRRGRPAADAERVFFATASGLVMAARRADGKVLWRRKLSDRTGRDLVLAGERLFVAGERNALYVLDARTGEIAWEYVRPTRAAVRASGGVLVALLGEGDPADGMRLVAFDLASDSALRARAEALAQLAAKLERAHDRPMLEALLRNVASPVDSDFRMLHLRLLRLRAEAGDVRGVLKAASRILALRDGDGGWFGDLEASLAIALQAAPAATAGSGSTRIPAAATGTGDFVRALRARLDALPLEERSQATPVDLMLLARARSPVEKEMLVERLRASKNRLAIPFLYELAMNGDANLRVLAAIALTDLGDYTAKEALREALRSGAVDRRRAAVQAVAKSFEPDDLEDLRTAATRDPDPAVRTEAALLVADREADSSVLAALHTALTDNDDEVKVRAAVALGKHGDRAGVPVLQSLLKARRGPVQVRAADALYELGDPSGLMVLLESRRREGGSSFLSTVRLVVGNIYMLLEDDRSALLEYRSILSFDREFDKAHANIGRLYYLRKRDRAAIAALDRALALNPFLAGAQIYRGLARARSGDVRGGLRDVEEALAKDPTSKLAALAKAEILVRRGEHEAAERVLGDALRRWPLHAPSFHHAARLRMGEAGREFANLSLAEELARKAVQLRPEDPSYLHTLAEIYEAQGRREQALRAAKRALHHSIGDPMRARMRKLVDRLSQQPPLDAAGRTTSAPPE